MKPVIGIVSHKVYSENNNIMFGVYEEIIDAIYFSGGIPISLLPMKNNWKNSLSLCDGLIFQGGDSFTNYEKKYMKYAHKKNIPTLGICLGMQLMGLLFDGKEIDINNHKHICEKYSHKVYINKASNLYKIFNKEVFKVNSRHKSALENTKLDIVAESDDNIIEAIEDKNKKFFIGVQWHPESLFKYDKLSKKLFKNFVDICKTDKDII